MRDKKEVVIIGGGVVGTSIAYQLAKGGLTDVVVLEKNFLASGATGRCGGGMRQQWSTRTNCLLAKHSINAFKNFAREMKQDIEFKEGGYLLVAYNRKMVKEFKTNIRLQNSLGIDTRLVTPTEIGAIAPILDTTNYIAASYGPTDGHSNPFLVVKGYADRARALGVEVRTCTEVSGLATSGARITGVKTADGDRIECDWVVNCAGGYAGKIGEMVGVELPVQPVRHQIMVTEPLDYCHDPMVIDLLHNIYFCQHATGGFVAGQTDKSELSSFNIRNNSEFLVEITRKLVFHSPLLKNVNVLRQWAGLYTMTPDAQPILGPVPQYGNFIQAIGFSGHGFMLAPATGKLISEYIIDGKTSLIEPAEFEKMQITRFEGEVTREANVV